MWHHAPCYWRGQDRQSPHWHNWNSPHALIYNCFHLFRCCYPSLGKKRWSGAERSACLYWSSKCGWWRISFVSRTAKICSSQSGLTQIETFTAPAKVMVVPESLNGRLQSHKSKMSQLSCGISRRHAPFFIFQKSESSPRAVMMLSNGCAREKIYFLVFVPRRSF